MTVTDADGPPKSVTFPATVGPVVANPPVSGGVIFPPASAGASPTNRPTLGGTAPAFSIIQVVARRDGVDATLPLGQTIADATGHWSLLVGPLVHGAFSVSAIVTPPGGSPTAPVPIGDNGRLYIDLVSPRFVGASGRPASGQVRLLFRDDLSGLSAASLMNTVNYTFFAGSTPVLHPVSVDLLPSGPRPTDPQGVILRLVGPQAVLASITSLRISGPGITDNAGNVLGRDVRVHLSRSGAALVSANPPGQKSSALRVARRVPAHRAPHKAGG